jgi:hypothetical protein
VARSYTMRGVQAVADEAVRVARRHLAQVDPASSVHDVQADPRFQHRGIDVLWERAGGVLTGVEIKGDRHAARGTYFFELVSNLERDTPGCFLYSEAELMLYVFVASAELHQLPLAATRAWFLPRAKEFELKHTRTRTGQSLYTTVGAVVPRRRVLAEVPGAALYR